MHVNGGEQASMAREEERNHTVQEFLVQDRSYREVMNKGHKETGLPMSKSYSWKAPEEPCKMVRAAIAASALSTSEFISPQAEKAKAVISVRDTHMSDTGWEAVMDACRRSSQTIGSGVFFPWKKPLYQNCGREKGKSHFRRAHFTGI